jgi:hypothetical protein
MKRREFVASVLATGVAVPALAKDDDQHRRHPRIDGDNASATVSFGHWVHFDRFAGAGGPNDRTQNGHALIPHEVKIKAGGTVNFIIAGFHQVIVYAPGTKPEDINSSLTTTVGVPPGPPLIDDPTNRVFRGVDPSRQPTQDRVEVVGFANPGRYLVICGVQPHFVNDHMFGYVRVLR